MTWITRIDKSPKLQWPHSWIPILLRHEYYANLYFVFILCLICECRNVSRIDAWFLPSKIVLGLHIKNCLLAWYKMLIGLGSEYKWSHFGFIKGNVSIDPSQSLIQTPHRYVVAMSPRACFTKCTTHRGQRKTAINFGVIPDIFAVCQDLLNWPPGTSNF